MSTSSTRIYKENGDFGFSFEKIQQQNKHNCFVVDAALIYESGADTHMDYVIVITSLLRYRTERVMSRNNMTRDDFLKRVSLQWPDEDKEHIFTKWRQRLWWRYGLHRRQIQTEHTTGFRGPRRGKERQRAPQVLEAERRGARGEALSGKSHLPN